MARPEYEPMEYLTKRGRILFYRIVRHINEAGIIMDIDTMELSMIANCFDLYEKAATYCNEKGYTGEFEGKNGSFKQVVPEYNVMQQQYDKILKHSSKFGLTPGDREKIFGGMKKVKKKVSVSDGLD
jgi:P27 family predicted phage terminase small subunit